MTYIVIALMVGMICWSWIQTKSIPDSISATAYIIPKWLFSVLTMIMGILLMPGLMRVLDMKYQCMGFLMVLGLTCVASSPYYKTEQSLLHYTGAIACFVFALGIIILLKPLALVIWIVYPLLLLPKTRKWWLLGAEFLCLIDLVYVLNS